jgi:hypothetical protein
MGFLSGLTKTLFGGTDKSSQKATLKQNEDTQQYIRQVTDQARGDVSRIIPRAAEAGQKGYNAALDLSQASAPMQIDALRGGNQAAQQALLAGLGGFNAGIMGQPMPQLNIQQANLPDYASLFAGIQRPQYNTPTDVVNPPPQNMGMITLPGGQQIPANLLGGAFF